MISLKLKTLQLHFFKTVSRASVINVHFLVQKLPQAKNDTGSDLTNVQAKILYFFSTKNTQTTHTRIICGCVNCCNCLLADQMCTFSRNWMDDKKKCQSTSNI